MRDITRVHRRSLLIAGLLAGLAGQVGAQTAATPETTSPAPAADPVKELDAMKQRISQLESQLKDKSATPDQAADTAATGNIAPTQDVGSAPAEAAGNASAPSPAPPADPQAAPAAAAAAPAAPPPVDLDTPFAFADFTWMLSNPRNHDEVLDGKYFSGEFRVDTNYMYDYNHPIDHTLDETTEGERTGEFVIQALGVGGDFHAGNMQGRILTQFGAVSTAVPRNDASYSQGQWDLADAYRYLTEMYGGYHINYKHGLNIQVGDFLSFIGLFSYYSFDNWIYQPSYVSSNTPWFFTGMRAQFFPTNKLKIEPWLINGWQTYAKYNGREVFGGQILYRPNGNLGLRVEHLYAGPRHPVQSLPLALSRGRSQEWKYYENPGKFMHRMAMTATEDFGCETGGGVVCTHGGRNGRPPAQNFTGIMAYQRLWFGDKFAFSYRRRRGEQPGPLPGAAAADQRRQRHQRHALLPGGSGPAIQRLRFPGRLRLHAQPVGDVEGRIDPARRPQSAVCRSRRNDASRRQQRLAAVLHLQRRTSTYRDVEQRHMRQ